MLQKGDNAPNFSLQDQNGDTRTLDEFKGNPFVLYFYPRDDTPGCTKEACSFNDDDIGVPVIGVSKDSVASHKKFANKYKLDIILLADPEAAMLKEYGAWQEKSMYGRTYMGIQRMTYIFDSNAQVVEVFPKVSVPGHSKAVKKIIDELQ